MGHVTEQPQQDNLSDKAAVDQRIEKELLAAQSGFLRFRKRRQAAVRAAADADWSPYRIAKVWKADETTVRATLAAKPPKEQS